MFNLQSFSTQKSGVSDGNTANALNRIRSLLTKLLHNPETGVIYLTSSDITDITKGMVVTLSPAPYSCTKAYAEDTPAQPYLCRGFAVCLNDTVQPGESGYFRFNGEAEVLFETALTLNAGDNVYVSDSVYGVCTNESSGIGNWVRVIGQIKDKSMYSIISPANLFARVVLNKCCESQIEIL